MITGALSGAAGMALLGSIGVADPVSGSLSVSISGAPIGMMFMASSSSITVFWPNPVAGNYTLTVTATDAAGATAQASVPVSISTR